MRTRTFHIRLYRNIVNGRISWLKYFELPAELKSKEGLAAQGRPSLLPTVLPVECAPLFHLFRLIFLHAVQFFDHFLQVGIERRIVVVWEAVPHGKARIADTTGIERVRLPVIGDM